MPVKPPAPKHTSEDLGSKLIISIPSKKDWLGILLTLFWLVMWSFGEFIVGEHLFFGNEASSDLSPMFFIGAWFSIWTIGGAFAIYYLLWQLFGIEEIQINAQSIIVNRIVLFLRFSKIYSSKFIKELRISIIGINNVYGLTRYMTYGRVGIGLIGLIGFDYGTQTIRIGSGVEEAEAKQIIAEIQQKFPQYKS